MALYESLARAQRKAAATRLKEVDWSDRPAARIPAERPKATNALAREAMILGKQSSDLQGQLSV